MLETVELLKRTSDYLHDVLAARPAQRPAKLPALPYFLSDRYTLTRAELLGRTCVFVTPKQAEGLSLAEVRKHIDLIARSDPQLVPVLMLPTLRSFERRALIEQQVAFVVPGNQLYIPELAVDLREHFKQRRTEKGLLSPATQALLFAALLLGKTRGTWDPSEDARRLGYSNMTVTRAVRELSAVGLVAVAQAGRYRHAQFEFPPQEIWRLVQPHLRSPVRRQGWIRPRSRRPRDVLRAGLGALAEQTMLAEPSTPVWAMSTTSWLREEAKGAELSPEATVDAEIWQIWTYGPAILPDQSSGDLVDPLSLMLSLRKEEGDERVQMALDALQGQLPWNNVQ